MGNKYLNNKKLTLPKQGALLKAKYPESIMWIKHNRLIWQGEIRPTSISRLYKIRITCERINNPKVILYGEHIEGIEKVDFPHIYRKDLKKQEVQLCLNMPYEFNYSMRIIDTVIPWTQEWLFFYEIWLVTGEWRGGGHRARN